MLQTVQLLERERDNLLSRIVDMQQDIEMEREEKDEAQKDLKLTQEKVTVCHQEAAEMASYVKQLNDKLARNQQVCHPVPAHIYIHA